MIVITGIFDIVFKNLFIFVSWMFGSMFSVISYQSKKLMSFFNGDSIGPRRFRITACDEVLFFLTSMFNSFMKTLQGAIIPLLVLGAIIFINFLVIISTYFFIITYWYFVFHFFLQFVNILSIFNNVFLQFLAPILNAISEIISTAAPAYNNLWYIIKAVFIKIADAACGNTPTDHSCPMVRLAWAWINNQFPIILQFIKSTATSVGLLVNSLSNIVCPNGFCDQHFCTLFIGQPICSLSPQLVIGFINHIIMFFLNFVLPVLEALVYFMLDIFMFAIKHLTLVISAITSGDTLTQFIQQQISQNSNPPSLVQTLVPAGLYRDVFGYLEKLILGVIQAILDSIKSIGILIDYLICNFFTGYKTCFASNVCYFLFRPIDFTVLGIRIYYDLSTRVCANDLGLSIDNCVCASCPTNVPFYSIFYNLGLLRNGLFLVPCNGEISCSGCHYTDSAISYSILKYILPIY